jgi:drug/metabolite transporter (DMT)-like permease
VGGRRGRAPRRRSERPECPPAHARIVALIEGGAPLGLAAAAAAAGCYDTAYALQALAARAAPARHALRPALVRDLLRSRLWVGATALAIAGWPLQLLALALAPLTLVQPTLALGLVLLLVLGARLLREPVGRREIAAVAAIVAGVAGIAWAAPGRTTDHAGAAVLAIVLGALGVVVASPYAVRAARRSPQLSLLVSPGAADAWAAVAAKLIVDDLSVGSWLPALGWGLGAGLAIGAGLLSEMTALQRFAATRVGPSVFVLQVAVPVLLAPLVAGERWGSTPLGGGALVVSLAVLGSGAAVLAASRSVGGLLADAGEDERAG